MRIDPVGVFVRRRPLTLALSPQAGRGDNRVWSAPEFGSGSCDDGGCFLSLLPVQTGRRCPTGPMRGLAPEVRP
jgi:hypothetical protein